MLVQLQPDQISVMWEGIRFSVLSADRVPEELQQDYAITLLQNLLSGNIQCWIVYGMEGEDKVLYAIATTSIIDEKIFGAKILRVNTLYGYRQLSDEMYAEGLDTFKKFAKSRGCKALIVETYSNKVRTMLSANGFEERSTIYQVAL